MHCDKTSEPAPSTEQKPDSHNSVCLCNDTGTVIHVHIPEDEAISAACSECGCLRESSRQVGTCVTVSDSESEGELVINYEKPKYRRPRFLIPVSSLKPSKDGKGKVLKKGIDPGIVWIKPYPGEDGDDTDSLNTVLRENLRNRGKPVLLGSRSPGSTTDDKFNQEFARFMKLAEQHERTRDEEFERAEALMLAREEHRSQQFLRAQYNVDRLMYEYEEKLKAINEVECEYRLHHQSQNQYRRRHPIPDSSQSSEKTISVHIRHPCSRCNELVVIQTQHVRHDFQQGDYNRSLGINVDASDTTTKNQVLCQRCEVGGLQTKPRMEGGRRAIEYIETPKSVREYTSSHESLRQHTRPRGQPEETQIYPPVLYDRKRDNEAYYRNATFGADFISGLFRPEEPSQSSQASHAGRDKTRNVVHTQKHHGFHGNANEGCGKSPRYVYRPSDIHQTSDEQSYLVYHRTRESHPKGTKTTGFGKYRSEVSSAPVSVVEKQFKTSNVKMNKSYCDADEEQDENCYNTRPYAGNSIGSFRGPQIHHSGASVNGKYPADRDVERTIHHRNLHQSTDHRPVLISNSSNPDLYATSNRTHSHRHHHHHHSDNYLRDEATGLRNPAFDKAGNDHQPTRVASLEDDDSYYIRWWPRKTVL